MARRARLFVVSGPSGVGKGTLVSRVRDRIPNLGLTVSATTRDPRAGEIPDVSYHFITEDEFERIKKLAQTQRISYSDTIEDDVTDHTGKAY